MNKKISQRDACKYEALLSIKRVIHQLDHCAENAILHPEDAIKAGFDLSHPFGMLHDLLMSIEDQLGQSHKPRRKKKS